MDLFQFCEKNGFLTIYSPITMISRLLVPLAEERGEEKGEELQSGRKTVLFHSLETYKKDFEGKLNFNCIERLERVTIDAFI